MESESHWQQQLEAFLAGKLSPQDEPALHRRLAEDEELKAYLDRRMESAFEQALREEAATHQYRREISAARQAMKPADGQARKRRWRFGWGLLLAGLVAGLVWLLLPKDTGSSQNVKPDSAMPAPTAPTDTIAPQNQTPAPENSPKKQSQEPETKGAKSPDPAVATQEQDTVRNNDTQVSSPRNKKSLFSGAIPLQVATISGEKKTAAAGGKPVVLEVLANKESQHRYQFFNKKLTLLAPVNADADFKKYSVVELREEGRPARFFLKTAPGQWFPLLENGTKYQLLLPETDLVLLDLLNQN